jgi:hypothetical protein
LETPASRATSAMVARPGVRKALVLIEVFAGDIEQSATKLMFF